jgi:hypothetical protein
MSAPPVIASLRADLIERCARAVYYELFAAAGQKSKLPKAFDELQPATKERCEVIALRVLQTAGVLTQ